MKKVVLLIGLTAFSAFSNEENFRIHKSQKGRFSVKYPATWMLTVDQKEVAFMASSPDSTANVQVKTESLKGRPTACEYLTQMEATAAGGRTNLIPEDKRRVTASQIKFMGVKDGCIGAYKVMQGEIEAMQGIGVYVNGKNVWILIQTLQSAAREVHGKDIGEIAKSFTTR